MCHNVFAPDTHHPPTPPTKTLVCTHQAVSGTDGNADVQCIVQSCEYASDLIFVWDGTSDTRDTRARTSATLSAARRSAAQRRTRSNARSVRPLAEMRSSTPQPAFVPPPEPVRAHAFALAGRTKRDSSSSSSSSMQRKLLIRHDATQPEVFALESSRQLEDGAVVATGADARAYTAIDTTADADADTAAIAGISPNGLVGGESVVGMHESIGEEDVEGMAVPMCERGEWRAVSPGLVQLAMKNNLVAFGAAGCAELHLLDDNLDWQHVASLPRSLTVRYVGSCMYIQRIQQQHVPTKY